MAYVATYRLSICLDCLHHLANGECGNCHQENGHDREPLSIIPDTDSVTLGLLSADHDRGCLIKVHGGHGSKFVPADFQCDCENLGFTMQSACDGCGSTLGGDRFGATGWENDRVKV